jgi:transposase
MHERVRSGSEWVLREVTERERRQIEHVSNSSIHSARLVYRAQILWHATRGELPDEIARRLGLDRRTVNLWIDRFNQHGFSALWDRARSGCPATYGPSELEAVLGAWRTAPRDLGLAFDRWTVRRLEAFLNERQGISIKRSRIAVLLREERVRLRRIERAAREADAEAQAGPATPGDHLAPWPSKRRRRHESHHGGAGRRARRRTADDPGAITAYVLEPTARARPASPSPGL